MGGGRRAGIAAVLLQATLLLLLMLLLSVCGAVQASYGTPASATSTTSTTTTISSNNTHHSNNTHNNNTHHSNNTHHNNNTHHRRRRRDEVSLRLRRDGLQEFRIAFRDVVVLETSPHPPSSPGSAVQQVVRLLQVTDGRQVVHMVKEGEVIKDCRWSSEAAEVTDFLQEYLHTMPTRPRRRRNLLHLYHLTPAGTKSVISNSTGGRQRHVHVHGGRGKRGALYRGVVMPLRRPGSLGHYADYLQLDTQLRQCQQFQSRVRQYLGVQQKGASSLQAKAGPASGSRRKRDLMTGWFIFPGTKWCGSGDIAEHPNDLGYDEALDSCCRDHDLCPHIIPRFTWRYGLFNFHLHTLSHCRCDRRFRRCLKKSQSPAAHMVGKIFFNVVGSQCFKFSKERACKRRNWWGKCKKYGFTKVAHPRKQRAF